MGGFGSGQWGRYDAKATTDDYHQLDMLVLMKNQYILPCGEQSGSLYWRRGKETIASISYQSNTAGEHPHLRVMYSLEKSGERMDYKITLSKTHPPYGGVRWWFLCPILGCGRRVRVLYMRKYFACRHCLKLTYQSRNEAEHERYLRKAQKISASLGGYSVEFAPRPKGMHHTTYQRKINEMLYYSDLSDEAFENRIAYFAARLMDW